jgi:hypothetical protein
VLSVSRGSYRGDSLRANREAGPSR